MGVSPIKSFAFCSTVTARSLEKTPTLPVPSLRLTIPTKPSSFSRSSLTDTEFASSTLTSLSSSLWSLQTCM